MRTYITSGISIMAFSASVANAGGFESSPLSTSFLYEEGGYMEVAHGQRKYDIKGSKYAPTGSAVKDQSTTSLSIKYDLSEQLAVGFSSYRQGSIQLDYSGAGSVIAAGLPVVDLSIDARVLLGKYKFGENYSVMAGVKQTVVKDATANIFQSVGRGPSSISGGSEVGGVFGIAYERPEIALRVELIKEQATDFELDTTNGGTLLAQKTKGSVPDYTTLNFQSGIATDTLLYGSVRKANWGANQLYVAPYATATSSFKDSTTYSLGIGRKFSEKWSGSVTYSTEKKGSKDSTSPLTITNGYQSVTVGAKYTKDNMSVSFGYNYTKVGDVDLNSALGIGKFVDNKVTGMGIKIGYSF